MWIRVLLAPWWVRTVVAALILGAGSLVGAVFLWFGDAQWQLPAVGLGLSALGCVVVGALLGTVVGQQRKLYLDALAVTASAAERSQAIDAVWRGPIPRNPRVRAAAGRIARIQLTLHEKNRSTVLVVYPLLVVLALFLMVMALVDHHTGRALWSAAIAGFWAYVSVWTLIAERRMRTRIQLLDATGEPATAARSGEQRLS